MMTYDVQVGVGGEEEGDDSGTESDDETETEPLEGDSEACSKCMMMMDDEIAKW